MFIGMKAPIFSHTVVQVKGNSYLRNVDLILLGAAIRVELGVHELLKQIS